MADNITLSLGTEDGPDLATDDIAGVQHQRVKVQHGADGSATDVSTASPMPVDLRADNLAGNLDVNIAAQTADITIADGGNTITVDNVGLTAINQAIGTDGSAGPTLAMSVGGTESGGTLQELRVDSDGHLQVDVLSGGGGGTQYAEDDAHTTGDTGTLALVVRNDTLAALAGTDGDYAPLQVDASGALYVQVDSSALPSGAATAANQTTIIGHVDGLEGLLTTIDADTGTLAGAVSGTEMQVDIVTSALPTGAATAANQSTGNTSLSNIEAAVATEGSALGSGVLLQGDDGTDRTNVLVDTAGHLQVDIQSGTVDLGATDNAVLDNIDTQTAAIQTAVELIDNAISGSEMQVDVVAALPAGTNAIGKLAANSGVDIGDVDVTSISAGSNLVGDVGLSGARTSGGTTLYKNIDVDESEDQVKGTAGQVYWITAMNLASGVRYLKLYNATAATVVVGTTTPDLTFPIPTQGDTNGAGFVLSIPNGIAFGTAITIAATTGVADADSGAPGANEVIVNLGYA